MVPVVTSAHTFLQLCFCLSVGKICCHVEVYMVNFHSQFQVKHPNPKLKLAAVVQSGAASRISYPAYTVEWGQFEGWPFTII